MMVAYIFLREPANLQELNAPTPLFTAARRAYNLVTAGSQVVSGSLRVFPVGD